MRAVIHNHFGKIAFVVVGVLQTLSLPGRAMAVDILDDPIQIDERVTQLVQASNSLCWEIYRYHQQKPDYTDTYRDAKQLWTDSTQIQADLQSGPAETEALQQKLIAMNQSFGKLADSLSRWGAGDQSSVPTTTGPALREVVAPGIGIDVPFVGIHIGGPDVVVAKDAAPQLQRRRLHPNAHGSKRSLERELDAVRVALSYLSEDAGLAPDNPTPDAPSTTNTPTPPAPKPGAEVVKPRS